MKLWEVHVKGNMVSIDMLRAMASRGELVITPNNRVIVKAETPYKALKAVYSQYTGKYPREVSEQEVAKYGYIALVEEVDVNYNIKVNRKGIVANQHFYQIF